jgi:hypothetical protein
MTQALYAHMNNKIKKKEKKTQCQITTTVMQEIKAMLL